MLKISLLLFLFFSIACSSDDKEQNGLPPEGYVFTEDGSLAPQTPGKCRIGQEKDDCPPPFNACPNGVCQVSTSPSDKYWFATDPIRPAVTSDCNASSGCTNPTGYIYNIMAKGYDSLDDWCASQAHLSNDKNVHNKSKWRALILANGGGNNGRPNTINPGCQVNCPFFDRLSDAFPTNGYKIPNLKTCTNGLCGKFGEDIKSAVFEFIYTTAWYGYDSGCTWVQIGTDPSSRSTCTSPANCLLALNGLSNLPEWVAGSLPGERPTAYWSDASGSSSGSIYMSTGTYSGAGCGLLGYNAVSDNATLKHKGYPALNDSFDTGDTEQQRVICLSN